MESPDTTADTTDATGSTDERPGFGRRRVLGVGLAAGAAAWVAPAILSVDAASAATQQPPPRGGAISGLIGVCGHGVDQGDVFDVTATQKPGGATGSTTSDGFGGYTISGLPAGTYDILLHPTDGIGGDPDENFPGAVVVVDGSTATFNPDYQANGC